MATRHICILSHPKALGGSYGVGDTPEAAEAKARQEWPHSRRLKPTVTHRETNVPEGRRLIIAETMNGLEWWTEAEEATPAR
jgi:hypothetical protein